MNDLHLPIDISSTSLESLDNRYSSGSSCINIKDGSNLISMKTSNESHICHGMRINLWRIWSFYLNLIHIHGSCKCQMFEDAEKDLKADDQFWHWLSSKNFIEPPIRFLKDAYGHHDVEAQRVGSQLLLALVNKSEVVGHTWEQTHSVGWHPFQIQKSTLLSEGVSMESDFCALFLLQVCGLGVLFSQGSRM